MINNDLQELKDHLKFLNDNYINAKELINIIESKKLGDRAWSDICILNEIIDEVKKLLISDKVSKL